MFIQSIDTRSLALPAWTQFEEPMSVTRLFGLPVANTTTELALDWLQHQIAAHADGSDGGLGRTPLGELQIEGIYPLAYLRMLTDGAAIVRKEIGGK